LFDGDSGAAAEPPFRRIALWIEYQGTRYCGFQLQLNQPTIQGALEDSLARFTGERIRVRGASRTDSGAHALGQVVDFLTASRHAAERFPPALNYFLPEDVRVRRARLVPMEFHSRRSACSRVYQYRILGREEPTALLRNTQLWVREALDTRRMAVFRPSDRVHYFDAAGLCVSAGDRVQVETDDGTREGTAMIGSDQVIHSDLRGPLLPVLRVLRRDPELS
jgi:hypothetical protein